MAQKRGVKPKPTALLKLQGTYQKSRHDRPEPKPEGELKQRPPPDDLTPAQQAIWTSRLAWAPPGMLADLDYDAFASYVQLIDARDRIVTAQRKLDEGKTIPFMVRGKGGHPIVSPLFRELQRTIASMTRLAAELGFTPSARTRISVDTTVPAASNPDDGGWGMLKTFPVIKGGKAG